MKSRDNIDKYRSPMTVQENSSTSTDYDLQEDNAEIDLAEGNLDPDTDKMHDLVSIMKYHRKGSV